MWIYNSQSFSMVDLNELNNISTNKQSQSIPPSIFTRLKLSPLDWKPYKPHAIMMGTVYDKQNNCHYTFLFIQF